MSNLEGAGSSMGAPRLECDACHVSTGPFATYQEWEDAARRLGWWVGESEVLCAICSGNLGPTY